MNDYTIQFIMNTADQKILAEILRTEKDDYVACYAASNPHCSLEVLVEIIKQRNNNDVVSQWAASNPTYKQYRKNIKEQEENKLEQLKSSVKNLFYRIQV